MSLFKQYIDNKSKDLFRRIDGDSNIANVTEIDEASEVNPEQAGLQQSQANQIWSAVEALYRTGMHPGVSFCLRKQGQIIFNRALGYAKGAQESEGIVPVLMSTKTPVCQYSASKAVMAMTVHKLAEEGYVKLLDPVSRYIPEFGKNGKEDITIHQMLGHHGGFPSVDSSEGVGLLEDRDNILSLIYDVQAKSPEGREQAYHAISSGFVADELIRRTTGKTIAEYLKEKFSDPMGMENFTFGLRADQMDGAAKNYITGMRNGRLIESVLSKVFGVSIEEAIEATNAPEFMQAVVPSANLYANAEEMGRFYQMMLDGGQYQGQQILTPETIKTAVREMSGVKLDKSLYLPMRYSAGFMLGGKPVGMYGINTHQAYGHLGFANIFCWADPQRQISVALLTTGKPIVGNHILALPKLLHTISKECL